jgi:hypothetical protein
MLLGFAADAAANATIGGRVTEAGTNNPIDQAVGLEIGRQMPL